MVVGQVRTIFHSWWIRDAKIKRLSSEGSAVHQLRVKGLAVVSITLPLLVKEINKLHIIQLKSIPGYHPIRHRDF